MKTPLFVALAASAGLLASTSWAETPLNLTLPGHYQSDNLLLAQNDKLTLTPTSARENSTGKKKPAKALHASFEESAFTPEKFHQYLGLTTLGLVALTAVLPKEEDGPHETAGTLAAITAGATVANGLIFHWEDFHFEDGFSDPDNLHMMLGTLGALLMVAAVSQAPEGGHAGLGLGGGVAMATAIKITW